MKFRRRWIIGALLLFLAAFSAYGLYWRHVAALLASGLADWTQAERQAGREIAYSFDGITGFPFVFRGTFRDARLGLAPDASLGSVVVAALLVEIPPWRIGHVAFSGKSPATLHLKQGDFTAETMSGILEFPSPPPSDHTQAQFGFSLDLSVIGLPPGRIALSEGPIAELGIAARIMGPLTLATDLEAGLDAWAKAGGTIEIDRFLFAQGPLRLEGTGTLALDAALQPVGAASIRTEGLGAALDLLASQGRLEAGSANAARLAVRALEMPAAEVGGAAVARLGLTLQDGFWWLGPLRLGPAPVLVW
jgi:Uncharacterized protein conserved in bacteria (DUF2125)